MYSFLTRCFVLGLVMAVFASAAMAQEPYRPHMLVKVPTTTKDQLLNLYRLDLDVVGGETPDAPYVVALPEHLQMLRAAGFTYEVLHENLERFYADRLDTPLDLMGGYHTFAEIVTVLDSIHTDHPAITTAKFSIGQSLQGREIWVMKISDNPGVDEDEPEVFYNSLIHAREPAAMEAVLYFMHYLTDNYGIDPEVTELVNNREMYFLPCANPDGYEYNRTTNPNGGGMWRKNRRNNGDGSYGVDLNRNWDAAWGIDNVGSSPTPSSETYRGTAPFSEPETQRLRDFINTRQFATQIDYHTYSNLVLIPWGTSYYEGSGVTEDDDIFRMIADSMVHLIHGVNGAWYAPGTPWELLYNTNGGSFDWEYEERTTKPKIFAVTPEVGNSSDGFWPPQNRILPLAQENLPSNLFIARIAGALAPRPFRISPRGQCETEVSGDGDTNIEPGETFALHVTIRNDGLQDLIAMGGQLVTGDPYATIIQGQSAWPMLEPGQSAVNTSAFQISIAAGCPAIHRIPLSLQLTTPAGLDTVLNLFGIVGFYTLADNVESGPADWIPGPGNNLWHISTRRAASPTHSWFCGNEAGNYANNIRCLLTSDTLFLGPGAELSFDHWYSLEANYDFAYVEISTGGNWSVLGAPFTGTSGNWQHVTLNLGLICPSTPVQIRFRMTTDGGVTAEGWYIDNISTGCSNPADIRRSPASLSAAVPLGGSATREIEICNDGECPLNWSIGFNQISPAAAASTSMTEAVFGTFDIMQIEDDKDAAVRHSGRDQLDASGGPDGFGYRWIDSNEPGGPVYNWVEVAAVGTRINFTADDQTLPVTLPWAFPFYGTGYSSMHVSSNGNLQFGTTPSNAYSNRPIPTSTAPNAMLAVFWDDLSPQNYGGAVYYYHDTALNRFIVQWDSVHHYPGTWNGVYTFEAILYPNGEVRYQYQSLSGDLNTCTVGIENPAGTDGLQVVYNAAYLTNNLAVKISAVPPWLTFAGAQSGSLNGGQCTNVAVQLAAGSLPAGSYQGEVIITSNDPDESPSVIPVTFIVGELQPPEDLVISYAPGSSQVVLTWTPNGAPRYQVYSSTSLSGPFETAVGPPVTGNQLTVTLPGDLILYFVVVATD